MDSPHPPLLTRLGAGFDRAISFIPVPSARTQRIIAVLVILSQALIAVTGSVVRVTASGLGCPTWPQCFPGSFTPKPHPEVSGWHQAIEFANRQIAVWVVVVLAGAIVIAVHRAQRRSTVKALAWCMPLATVFQAVLGGITVLTGLLWWTVALHLAVSMVMVWLAAALWVQVSIPDDAVRKVPRPAASPLGGLSLANAAFIALAVIAGTLVTGAGPHAGDKSTEDPVARLAVDIPILTAIHGLLVCGYLATLFLMRRHILAAGSQPESGSESGSADSASRPELLRRWHIAVAVACAQALIGVVQYFTDVPAVLVVLHVAGASSAVAESAILFTLLRYRNAEIPVGAGAANTQDLWADPGK